MVRPKLMFLQAGDYGDAWKRFADGGAETYRDQRLSVDFVDTLSQSYDVTVVSLIDGKRAETLKEGLRALTIPRPEIGPRRAEALMADLAPDHLICRMPHVDFLDVAGKRGVSTLPVFADLLRSGLVRGRRHVWRLRRAINRLKAPCVANHSLNASRSVVTTLGVATDRVVPWDWTRLDVSPDIKMQPGDTNGFSVFFAGILIKEKGIGDCIAAIATLASKSIPAHLHIAGKGDISIWQEQAQALGVGDRVTFHGLLSHAEVRERMQRHDVVVVPSRPDYPEGLPNTIYEALAARTPLVISDHPAFQGRIREGEGCLSFPAGRPDALAGCLERLLTEPALYARLSERGEAAHEALYIGMEWSDLIRAFLDDPTDKKGWVRANALSTLDATTP